MAEAIDGESSGGIEMVPGIAAGSTGASLVAGSGRLVALDGSAGMSCWGHLGTAVGKEVTVAGPGRRCTALVGIHLEEEVVQARLMLVLGWESAAVVGLLCMAEVLAA